MFLAVKINVALRELNCQKIGSERVNTSLMIIFDVFQTFEIKHANSKQCLGSPRPNDKDTPSIGGYREVKEIQYQTFRMKNQGHSEIIIE